MMPEPPPPLDFEKVEALRKHMLLNTGQFAQVLGVSRVSYSKWVKGNPIRPTNDAKVRNALRKLLAVMTTHDWPTPEVISMDADTRFEKLLEAVASLEQPE